MITPTGVLALGASSTALPLFLTVLGKTGTDRAIGGGFAVGAGILSCALVAGGASGIFLTLEVARWGFMLGLSLLAGAVNVGPDVKGLIAPLALAASVRLGLAAVTWLYML